MLAREPALRASLYFDAFLSSEYRPFPISLFSHFRFDLNRSTSFPKGTEIGYNPPFQLNVPASPLWVEKSLMNRSVALYFAFLFAALAFVLRFSPVPTNFACIGALSLFAGCYLRGWLAFAVPMGTMFLTEVIGHFGGVQDMGFYNFSAMLCVYGGFLGMSVIGMGMRRFKNPMLVLSGAVVGSLFFFAVSNFGSWLDPVSGYPASLAGLIECYTLGIPFHRNTLTSDLFFTALFFGSYEIYAQTRSASELSTNR